MSFIVVFFFLYCASVSSNQADDCTQINSCSCRKNSGEVIDLSPLALSGGNPIFKDIYDSRGNYYYSWNPCEAFTEGPYGCAGVSGCQTDLTNYFSLGTPESAKFKFDIIKGLILSYSSTTDVTRTLDVILVCDENTQASLEVEGETPPGSAVYEMTLTSKYCCPRKLYTTTTQLPTTTTITDSPTTKQPNPLFPFNDETIILIQIAILIAILLLMVLSGVIIGLLVSRKSSNSYSSMKNI